MTAGLIRPELLLIIPKPVVDALIADADQQISALEHEAERALAAADDAEARRARDRRARVGVGDDQLERFVT